MKTLDNSNEPVVTADLRTPRVAYERAEDGNLQGTGLVGVITGVAVSLQTALTHGIVGMGVRVESIDGAAKTLEGVDHLRHSKARYSFLSCDRLTSWIVIVLALRYSTYATQSFKI